VKSRGLQGLLNDILVRWRKEQGKHLGLYALVWRSHPQGFHPCFNERLLS